MWLACSPNFAQVSRTTTKGSAGLPKSCSERGSKVQTWTPQNHNLVFHPAASLFTELSPIFIELLSLDEKVTQNDRGLSLSNPSIADSKLDYEL